MKSTKLIVLLYSICRSIAIKTTRLASDEIGRKKSFCYKFSDDSVVDTVPACAPKPPGSMFSLEILCPLTSLHRNFCLKLSMYDFMNQITSYQ